MIYNIFKQIRIWFVLLRADIQLRYAIKEAKEKYSRRNVRYYVIPNYDHRLITCNRSEVRKYRTDGYFAHSVRIDDFNRECFYYTPYANGKNPISAKERALKRRTWLNYVLQAKGLI